MHVHAPTDSTDRSTRKRLLLSLAITVLFIGVELSAGIYANSLALISDAGHNFTDSLALGLALFAFLWQQRPPNEDKTYGYHRAGVLAAFVNALTLMGLSVYILWESYERLRDPLEVRVGVMVAVASIGLAVNLAVMWALHQGSKDDINVRGAFVHMLGDALSSVGVIVGGLAIRYTGLNWIDPALSVVIALLILWSAWGIVSDALHILLEASPKGVKLGAVREALQSVEGVDEVHDLHIWSLSSNTHALSCHAVISDVPPSESETILKRMKRTLAERFRICHTTIQFESQGCSDPAMICSDPAGRPVGSARS